MSKSDWMIRVFVWLALLGYVPGAAYALTRPGGGRWDKIIRWIWTASGFCLLLHIALALHFVHHWNQHSVYVETARQTAAIFNVNWGGGMYINYALLSLWLLDLVWWWRWPDSYRRRPRWLTMIWQGFLLFIFFNATVVFVSGVLRWLGVLGTIILLWWWSQWDAAKLFKFRQKQNKSMNWQKHWLMMIGLTTTIFMNNIQAQSKLTILRTPEERFAKLVDYPFAPHYAELKLNGQAVRMHYVDEGKGEVVLMLHGEPSWSYLYRKMIPLFVKAGYRAIAPDLIGFGKSDKLANKTDYSYKLHVDLVTQFVKQLKVKNITLVCQDWGGLIGLRVAAENEALFARIAASNTGLPTGESLGPGFKQWLDFSQRVPELPIGFILKSGSQTPLAPEVVAAYDAPFPDESYKAAARVFPTLVPITPDAPAVADNKKAWEVLSKWKKPFLTSFSDGDQVTAGGEKIFQARVPGASGQPHTIIKGGGHFVQEDKGEEWAALIIEWVKLLKH